MVVKMNLVPASRIELDERFKKCGLYESFYFRGDSQDGKYSFWLKHNLIRFRNSFDVRVDNIFVLFSYQDKKVSEWHQSKNLKIDDFYNLVEKSKKSWNSFEINFEGGGFAFVGEKKLKGKIPVEDKWVSWDFDLIKSNKAYFHFDKKWFYTGFFPKKKILTNDICVKFNGDFESPAGDSHHNPWVGMNGHNWGKEHAYNYAYADCNRFEGYAPGEIYFDGFSAKIKFSSFVSPYLSGCSFKVKDQFFHFNSVLTSYKHSVGNLDLKNWEVIFFNKDYELKIKISGENSLWSTLEYDHPNRLKSLVNNTKNSVGEFYLKSLNGNLVSYFKSDWVELETLLPPLN